MRGRTVRLGDSNQNYFRREILVTIYKTNKPKIRKPKYT